MKIRNILVTGESLFLDRRQGLISELANYVDYVNLLPRSSEWYETRLITLLIKAYYAVRIGSISNANTLFQKNHQAFALKSKRAEYQISQLNPPPDLVLHLFSTYSPFWNRFDIPYAMYLDYTMALAEKNWKPWASFIHVRERNAWFNYEQRTYSRSKHLFVMSDANQITTVGASSSFTKPYEGEKKFGSQQILFNGSDFTRKGGDILFEAFKVVKQVLPNAKLVVIGKKISTSIPGIKVLGNVSTSELENIFVNTDLVVAPARCEPFGIFLIDAMSYGIPCVIAQGKGNGITEFLEHEVDGVILNDLSVNSLARYIIWLLSNPCLLNSMSNAVKLKTKSRLSWKTIASTTIQTLADRSG
jgi:glycogen synthase